MSTDSATVRSKDTTKPREEQTNMLVCEAIKKTSTEVLDHLAHDAEIPLVTKAACQGDVSLLRVTTGAATTPIPAAGVAVVRGESGGNTHSLHADPVAFFDAAPAREGGVALGTLTVPEGSTAVLGHPEHGFLQVGPGTYRIGRQREQADIVRAVAD